MKSGVTAIFSADIYLIPLAVGWRIVVDVSEEGWSDDTERKEETHGEAEEECRGGEVDEDHAVLTGTRRPTLLAKGRTCKRKHIKGHKHIWPKGLSSLTGFYWQFQIQTWVNAQQQNIVFLFWFVMQVKT